MNIESYREFCLSFPGTSEELPFDNNTLVFKVMGKIFSICDIENFESINVKCNPEKALDLRTRYTSVQPGYHMNKKHWNTIAIDGELTDRELEHWIRHSYELVVSKLPKKDKEALQEM